MDIRIIGREIQIDTTAAIAVENDNQTETACFILDRYTESGIDLWGMNGFLVYLNALGTRFETLRLSLVGDKVHAKWVVTRALTTINGRFSFCLTFLSADTYDGLPNAEKVWSTNVAQSNISGSLIGKDYAVPEEPIILQMLEIANQVASIERDSKINADRAKKEADRAAEQADIVEAQVDQIGHLLDLINGEVI